MSLYPSLEDMMVHSSGAVSSPAAAPSAQPSIVTAPPAAAVASSSCLPRYPSLYPSLSDMGLDLSPAVLEEHALAVAQFSPAQVPVAVARPVSSSTQSMIAPVTGNNDRGMLQSEIKQGLRPILLCKDVNGKAGLAVAAISKGIFVAFVYRNSPAAQVGLRFGDQILQINGKTVAGLKATAVEKIFREASPERIEIAVRDRPFERTVTMQKDAMNHVGFVYKRGLITAIVKDSSAARNGLVIDHYLVEVNGQNVVGMSDDDISKIFAVSLPSVTITIMPDFLYNHMVKHIGSLKKYMDHSIPEI
eukprot:scpid81209/ scgid3337/ Syntenin-1; Scaffold protein Pbp1; Syndecan-binding protein 1